MFETVTYRIIFGLPFVIWMGIMAILTLFFAGLIPALRKKGVLNWPYESHMWVARISIGFAVIHAVLGIAFYL